MRLKWLFAEEVLQDLKREAIQNAENALEEELYRKKNLTWTELEPHKVKLAYFNTIYSTGPAVVSQDDQSFRSFLRFTTNLVQQYIKYVNNDPVLVNGKFHSSTC